jgi:hypothetical protein
LFLSDWKFKNDITRDQLLELREKFLEEEEEALRQRQKLANKSRVGEEIKADVKL